VAHDEETEGEEIEGEEHEPIDVEPDLLIPVTFMSQFGSHTADEACPAEGKGWCSCQGVSKSETAPPARLSTS
jgi:hypothetical protein